MTVEPLRKIFSATFWEPINLRASTTITSTKAHYTVFWVTINDCSFFVSLSIISSVIVPNAYCMPDFMCNDSSSSVYVLILFNNCALQPLSCIFLRHAQLKKRIFIESIMLLAKDRTAIYVTTYFFQCSDNEITIIDPIRCNLNTTGEFSNV